MVFQDPYSTLNPRHSIRRSLTEALRTAGGAVDNEDRIVTLLREVGLPGTFAERRPASLSGGERQRVAVARSLAVAPKILVCDEPVSALDVSVQAQILNLFKRLQDELGLSYLFITHDLAVVRQIVDRVYVLYLGEIVEQGPTEEVMNRPKHPYTRRLIDSIPRSASLSEAPCRRAGKAVHQRERPARLVFISCGKPDAEHRGFVLGRCRAIDYGSLSSGAIAAGERPTRWPERIQPGSAAGIALLYVKDRNDNEYFWWSKIRMPLETRQERVLLVGPRSNGRLR